MMNHTILAYDSTSTREDTVETCPSCGGLGWLHDGQWCLGCVRKYNFGSRRRRKKMDARLERTSRKRYVRWRGSHLRFDPHGFEKFIAKEKGQPWWLSAERVGPGSFTVEFHHR